MAILALNQQTRMLHQCFLREIPVRPRGTASSLRGQTSLSTEVIWAIRIVGLISVLCVSAMIVRSVTHVNPPTIPGLKPSFFFWLEMLYLLILGLVAIEYSSLGVEMRFAGMLPVAVPWFGALGAVVISLQAVMHSNDQWDSKYNYWHIARPVVGATVGTVAFFIMLLIGNSSGALIPILNSTNGWQAKDVVLYYVIAFLVGYREETFRELIRRASDLILQPGGKRPLR